MYGMVAYAFLSVCEKTHQFLLSINKMHTKENWFLFSASWCTMFISVQNLPHFIRRLSFCWGNIVLDHSNI